MFKPLYFLATFAEAGLSVFGIRSYEEPAYAVTRVLADQAELRAYPARVAAETDILDGAEGDAFGRLFRYITGANTGGSTLAMTVPVQRDAPGGSTSRDGQAIAMTVPVELADGGASRRMRFFLPREAADRPPSPTDPKVRIVTLPPTSFATLRFSGLLTAAARAAAAGRLMAILHRAGLTESGPPVIFSYDPPFTIPFLRRNEVAIPVGSS